MNKSPKVVSCLGRAKAVLKYNCKGIVNHAWKRLHLLYLGCKLGGLKQKYVLNVKGSVSLGREIWSSHPLQVRQAAPHSLTSSQGTKKQDVLCSNKTLPAGTASAFKSSLPHTNRSSKETSAHPGAANRGYLSIRRSSGSRGLLGVVFVCDLPY